MDQTLLFPLGDTRCVLLPQFLEPATVAALHAQLSQRGFASADSHYPPSYRNNQRLLFDDAALAEQLCRQLRAHGLDGRSDDWELLAVNPRWRSCRYLPGQAFPIHQDGVFHAADGAVSRRTFMLYLSDPDTFSGGDTVFYDGPPDHLQPPRELARVRPPAGALIVFDHALWHAGDTVTAGSKTILRSELLYQPLAPQHLAPPDAHRGYVFCLADTGDGRVLSGGRDGQVRCHDPQTQRSRIVGRHAQSVLGIVSLGNGRCASVSRDQSLRLHAMSDASELARVQAHDGAALCIARLDPQTLLTGGADHQIALWSLRGDTPQLQSRLSVHGGWVWDLAALDARRFASVGEEGAVWLWVDGQPVSRVAFDAPLRSLCAVSGGLIVGDAGGRLHGLRRTPDDRLQRLRSVSAHRAQLRRVRADPRGGGLLSAGEDGQLLHWSDDLSCCRLLGQRAGFATDLLRLADGTLVSAGYEGGVQWQESPKVPLRSDPDVQSPGRSGMPSKNSTSPVSSRYSAPTTSRRPSSIIGSNSSEP